MPKQLLKLNEEIRGAHPLHKDYPLYPGDVLTRERDGTYMKHTGICIFGFVLTPEQEAALEPVDGSIILDGSL